MSPTTYMTEIFSTQDFNRHRIILTNLTVKYDLMTLSKVLHEDIQVLINYS